MLRAFFFFRRIIRKRRQTRAAAYQRVELQGKDEPPFIRENMQRRSVGSEPWYPLKDAQYTPYVPEEHQA